MTLSQRPIANQWHQTLEYVWSIRIALISAPVFDTLPKDITCIPVWDSLHISFPDIRTHVVNVTGKVRCEPLLTSTTPPPWLPANCHIICAYSSVSNPALHVSGSSPFSRCGEVNRFLQSCSINIQRRTYNAKNCILKSHREGYSDRNFANAID